MTAHKNSGFVLLIMFIILIISCGFVIVAYERLSEQRRELVMQMQVADIQESDYQIPNI